MDYDDKDRLIKDPNKLSIFFIKFRVDSPFTRQSLKHLGFSDSVCTTISFEEFKEPKLDPLEQLVKYMHYITDKYKVLQQVQIQSIIFRFYTQEINSKMKQIYQFENNRSTKPEVKDHLSQFLSIQVMLLTYSAFITNNPETTKKASKQQRNSMSHSFHHSSLDVTHEEKLLHYKQRNQGFQDTYLRQISNSDKQMKELEEFYEYRKPFYEAKIMRIQEENKVYKIFKIQSKFINRLKKRSDKQAKTVQKIKNMQDLDLEERQKVNDELDDRQLQNLGNRQRLEQVNRQAQREKDQEGEYLSIRREQKKTAAIQMEEQELQRILGIQQQKDQRSKDHIETIKYVYMQKKEQKQKTYNQVKERVEQTALSYQTSQFNTFMNHQIFVQDQLLEHKKKVETLQNDKHKIFVKLTKKINGNKEKQLDSFQHKMDALQEREDEKLNKLRCVQSTTDLRAQDYMAKNKERIERVLIQCAFKQQQKETSQLRMIEKLKGNDDRVKLIKREQEELKTIGFQQHVEFKRVMESILLKRKVQKS